MASTPRTSQPKKAGQTYRDLLIRLGHGWPMWFPDMPGDHEITIGDVGYMDEDGAFRPFFNVTKSGTDPMNAGGVPLGYVPLAIHESVINAIRNCLSLQAIVSRDVKALNLSGGAGTSHIDAKLAYSFTSSVERGAILVLKYHAHKKCLVNNKHIKSYIRSNFDAWYQYATALKPSASSYLPTTSSSLEEP